MPDNIIQLNEAAIKGELKVSEKHLNAFLVYVPMDGSMPNYRQIWNKCLKMV